MTRWYIAVSYTHLQKPANKYSVVKNYIDTHPGKSGIIYCLTRKLVEEVCQRLCAEGVAATRYHAGLSDEERRQNQDDFIYDVKPIMVATNAFGMGIDKSNVNFVIHYNMPKTMASYYQEAGRAGRDGEKADCILLYGGKDVVTNQFFIEKDNENEDLDEEERELIRERDRQRLKKMTVFGHTNECLRNYMRRYFGEKPPGYCGNWINLSLRHISAVFTGSLSDSAKLRDSDLAWGRLPDNKREVAIDKMVLKKAVEEQSLSLIHICFSRLILLRMRAEN